MSDYFEDKVLVRKEVVRQFRGISVYFATPTGSTRSCRESFSIDYWSGRTNHGNISDMFQVISFQKDGYKIIPKFILAIERLLNVESHSKFYKLNCKVQQALVVGQNQDIIGVAIAPSDFWRSHKIKFSFLTAALKVICVKPKIWDELCHKTKSKKAFFEVLTKTTKGADYFGTTKLATKRFLVDGCTNVNYKEQSVYDSAGWVNILKDKNFQIKKRFGGGLSVAYNFKKTHALDDILVKDE